MPTDTYDDRRERLHTRVRRSDLTMADLARRIQDENHDYTHGYIRHVLIGSPGKHSEPLLDKIEDVLDEAEV